MQKLFKKQLEGLEIMSTDLGGHINSRADMAKVARTIVEYCADVKAGENVVVTSDDFQSPNVYQSVFNAANAAGADATLLVYPTPDTRIPGEWIKTPKALLSAAKTADCVIVCSKTHLGRDLYKAVEFESKNSRMLFVQGMSEESIIRTTPVDFEKVVKNTERLIGIFDEGKEVEVTSPSGTNIRVNISGAESRQARGTFKLKTPTEPHSGKIEFLPAGRIGTFIDKTDSKPTGTIVMDGFLGLGLFRGNIILTVKDGRVEDVQSKGAEQWCVETMRQLFNLDRDANHVVEVGVGTNPRARLVGSYEDYGAIGSIRFGFGSEGFHGDCFIASGTLKVDGQVVVKDGWQQIAS